VKVGAILLAAGSSSRLGQPKQLLTFRGKTFVRLSVEAAIEAGCSPAIAVIGRDRDRIARELRDLPIEIVWNQNWESGLGGSIRAGVEAARNCDAVVILACDQPHVDAALLRRLIETHSSTGKAIVPSAYAGTLGIPALFGWSFFHALLSLGDEEGAKPIVVAHPGEVAGVDFPAGAVDIDTPEDYGNLPNES
jgi:molybdenum cofactor cytidylyltransferase